MIIVDIGTRRAHRRVSQIVILFNPQIGIAAYFRSVGWVGCIGCRGRRCSGRSGVRNWIAADWPGVIYVGHFRILFHWEVEYYQLLGDGHVPAKPYHCDQSKVSERSPEIAPLCSKLRSIMQPSPALSTATTVLHRVP